MKISREARSILYLALAFLILLYAAQPLAARRDQAASSATQPGPAPQSDAPPSQPSSPPSLQDGSKQTPDGDSSPASQSAEPSSAPSTPSSPSPAASPSPAPSAASPNAASKDTRKAAPELRAYPLTTNYSVNLPSDWTPTSGDEIPPPPALSSYAPFHLSGDLVLSNLSRGAILQFATSNNPFIGHDAYWLDTQMHAPSGSGMSLLDFFFYYFFPPSDACMHQVLTTYAPASRQSPTDGPAYLQVYYACPLSDTLSDFYSAQISSGITFQHTDDGTRVLAPVGDFYVAPMDEIDDSGMTFYVFEAQGMNSVSSDATKRFHLPSNTQGGAPDFFWAIGAPTPFPFVADAITKDVPILHVAYARLGVDADAKTEFLNILREVRTHQLQSAQ